ncbi:MAG: suppressor of fused domain protein [Oscillospiraceae bacterium]
MYDKVTSTLGGNQKSFSYFQTKDYSIDILFCKDSPKPSYLTCATLGLVNKESQFTSNGKSIHIELLGLSTNKDGDTLGRIMSSLYRNVLEKNLPCAYGIIYTGFLEGILKNSEMKHIIFTAPPLFWEKSLGVLDLDDKNILTWLYAMPISDAERQFIISKGDEHFKEAMVNLQDIFTVKNIDVFDFNRKSAI